MKKSPFQQIIDTLSTSLSDVQLELLPRKWEKIGNVLILSLEKELIPVEKRIASVYAEVLSCKSVLKDIGGISGKFREPSVELIYGDSNTITIHKENGVLYKIDPMQLMFSSGNMSERKRMGEFIYQNETVVDLFAGIGYFSLPIAVHGYPKKVFCCECNPVAYSFLEENITLNKVTHLITPILGDNRKVAPLNIAHRVIMGFFGETSEFLPVAFNSLVDNCGIIHFHDTFSDRDVPEKPLATIQKIACKFNRIAILQHVELVKSFAPGINHYVLDVSIRKR